MVVASLIDLLACCLLAAASSIDLIVAAVDLAVATIEIAEVAVVAAGLVVAAILIVPAHRHHCFLKVSASQTVPNLEQEPNYLSSPTHRQAFASRIAPIEQKLRFQQLMR